MFKKLKKLLSPKFKAELKFLEKFILDFESELRSDELDKKDSIYYAISLSEVKEDLIKLVETGYDIIDYEVRIKKRNRNSIYLELTANLLIQKLVSGNNHLHRGILNAKGNAIFHLLETTLRLTLEAGEFNKEEIKNIILSVRKDIRFSG